MESVLGSCLFLWLLPLSNFWQAHLLHPCSNVTLSLRPFLTILLQIATYPIPLLTLLKVKVQIAHLCPALCNPMDYTLHGILQVRILEWVVFPFYRGSSWPRNRARVSCIAGRFFTNSAIREALFSPFSAVQSLSHVQLFVNPWTAEHQASRSGVYKLSEFTQTHVHRVSDAIQPSHPLPSSSPPAPNPSQHQSLFQ